MNAALALIEGVAPRNEIEGAIAVQMACTHATTLQHRLRVINDFHEYFESSGRA